MYKFCIQIHFCAILRSRDIWKTKCSSEVDKFEFTLVVRSTFLLRVISEHLKRSQTGHWLTLIPLNEPLEAPSYCNWSTKLLDYFQIGFLSKYAILPTTQTQCWQWVINISAATDPISSLQLYQMGLLGSLKFTRALLFIELIILWIWFTGSLGLLGMHGNFMNYFDYVLSLLVYLVYHVKLDFFF